MGEILEGRERVRIHGKRYEVRARIARINGFSAHGDRDDLLRWLGHFDPPPRAVFLTHGEERASRALAETIEERALGKRAIVPEYQHVETLP